MNLILDPSCDIHLALSPAIFDSVDLRVRFRRRKTLSAAENHGFDYDLIDVTDNCTFNIIDNPAFGTIISTPIDPLNPKVIGTGIGEAYLVVSYPTGGHFIVSKITVHQRINSWWFGANQLTIPNKDNLYHCQVPIYALFDSDVNGIGVIEEITGQEFVQLEPDSHSSNYFTTDIYGRIKVVNKSADKNNLIISGNCIDSSITSPNLLVLPITVLNTEQGLVVRSNHTLMGKRNHIENHNLLLVGEGFSSFDEFKDLMEDVLVPDIFMNERHSPFLHLKNDINLWYCFQENNALENGITYPIHEAQITGVDNSDAINQAGGMPLLYQMTNSHLGFSFSGRKADKISSTNPAPLNFIDADTYWTTEGLRIKEGKVGGDMRRYSPSVSWEQEFKRYITGTVNEQGEEIGWLWKRNNNGFYVKDFGFIAVIIKDYGFRAWNSSFYGFFFNHLSRRSVSNVINRLGTLSIENNIIWKVDRKLPPLPVFNSVNPNTFVSDNYRDFLDTFGHEWGHSFNLGDEYEEHADHGTYLAGRPFMPKDNLQNYREITTPPPVVAGPPLNLPNLPYTSFDIDKVKWAKLPRMDFSVKVSENCFLTPLGGNKFKVNIKIKKDVKFHVASEGGWKKHIINPTLEVSNRMKILLYMPLSDNSLRQMRPYPPIIERLDYEGRTDKTLSFNIDESDFPVDASGNSIIANVAIPPKKDKQIFELTISKQNKLTIVYVDGTSTFSYVHDTPVIITDNINNSWVVANGNIIEITSTNRNNFLKYVPKNSILYHPKLAHKNKAPVFYEDSVTGIPNPDDPVYLYLMFNAAQRHLAANNLPLNYNLGFSSVCNFNNDPNPNIRYMAEAGPEPPSQNVIDQIKGVNGEFLHDEERITNNNPERVVGIYEGGGTYSCGIFRPTGHCKMRTQRRPNLNHRKQEYKSESAYCQVCKYVIVNRINPSLHHTKMMDEEYGTNRY